MYSYAVPAAGGYDATGNVKQYVDSVMGTWNFSYDTLNRLTSAVPGAGAPGNYTGQKLCMAYDSFGNRSQSNLQTTACAVTDPATATYTAANQVSWTTVNSAANGFTYDAAGNVLYDGQNYYAYDADGQLCAMQTYPYSGGVVAIGYLYDAEGRRVAKGNISPSSNPLSQPLSCNPATNGFTLTESYVLGQDGEQLTTLDQNGGWKRTNIASLATLDTTGLHYQLTDPLGTRRVQVDPNGEAELNCQSLPFGDQQSCYAPANAPPTSDDATPLHFTGKIRDTETGNDYFGARYYNSSLGRFVSPDPSQLYYADPSNPQSLNLYAFVRNSPLTSIDPDGLDASGTTAVLIRRLIQTRVVQSSVRVKTVNRARAATGWTPRHSRLSDWETGALVLVRPS